MIDGRDRQREEERLRVDGREEHARGKDEEVQRRAQSGGHVAVERDQAHEVEDRDGQGGVGDQDAGGEVGIVASSERRAEHAHEERVQREERHVRPIRVYVPVAREGEI